MTDHSSDLHTHKVSVAFTPPAENVQPAPPRWVFNFQERDRSLHLAEGLLLEWKSNIKVNKPGGIFAEVIQTPDESYLAIETPSEGEWIRMVAPFEMTQDRMQLAVHVMVMVESTTASGPATLGPVLGLRERGVGKRRTAQAETRTKLRLELGQWHAINGLFAVDISRTGVVCDFMMNLPHGYQLRIGALELDCLDAAPGGADDEVVQVISPFAAEQPISAAGKPQMHMEAGAQPSLTQTAAILRDAPRDPVMLAVHLSIFGPQPQAAMLIEILFEWAGYAVTVRPTDAGTPPSETLTRMVLENHLGRVSEANLSNLDHLAFHAIALEARLRQGLSMTAPQPVEIVLEKAPSEADLAYWQTMRDTALVAGVSTEQAETTGQVLHLDPRVRLSPLALMGFACTDLVPDGAEIMAEKARPSQGSWRSHIKGFFDSESPMIHVGTLSDKSGTSPPNDTQNVCIAAMADAAESPQSKATVSYDTAYAFVICADVKARPETLTNIEKCVVLESLDALKETLADKLSERTRRKPVIFVHSQDALPADYIVQCNVQHWAHGGRYPMSWLACDYNSTTGEVRLSAVPQRHLQRFSATKAITSVPLALALSLGMDEPFVILEEGVMVCHKIDGMPVDQAPLIQQSLAPQKIPQSQHAQLHRLGNASEIGFLKGINLLTNWPIAELITPQLLRHQNLEQRLQLFATAPSLELAQSIFKLLDAPGDDRLIFDSELSAFALTLSEVPRITLALDGDEVISFLNVAGCAASADQIGANLAVYCDRLVAIDAKIVFPLCEFLALTLPHPTLIAAFTLMTTHSMDVSNRHAVRLIECVKRFGGVDVQWMLMMSLHRTKPAMLQNPEILARFLAMLESENWPVIASQIGDRLATALKQMVEPLEPFIEAVRLGDRQTALRLMNDHDAMQKIDFLEFMNVLRAFSNELRDLSLPILESPAIAINSLPRQRLAGIIFGDVSALKQLQTEGFLDDTDVLNAIALHIVGDPKMLDAVIAERFAETPYAAFSITGETTLSVFTAAQTQLAELRPAGDGPLVTAIMSAFNPDIDLMRVALDSIRHQTHYAVEIIVIDDASAPESATAIRELTDTYPQVTLLRMDENSGPYIGRNKALEIAKGEFIAIHDADDWAHPQRFEAQLAALAAAPEAQVVTTQHIRVDKAGNVQLERLFTPFGDGAMTSLFRRQVFDEVGVFAAVRSRGDVEMRERIRSYFGHGSICEIAQPMLLCFADSGTLSQLTQQNKAEFLQLFRTRISTRPKLGLLYRTGVPISAGFQTLIPHTLRAPQKDKQQ